MLFGVTSQPFVACIFPTYIQKSNRLKAAQWQRLDSSIYF